MATSRQPQEGSAAQRRVVTLDIGKLNKDELQYELDLRGIPHHAVPDRGDLVRLLRRHQRLDTLDNAIGNLNVTEELHNLLPKIEELQALCREARLMQEFHQEPSRLGSLFIHVSFRMRRVMFRAMGDEYQEFRRLAKKMRDIHAFLAEKFPMLEFPRITAFGFDSDRFLDPRYGADGPCQRCQLKRKQRSWITRRSF